MSSVTTTIAFANQKGGVAKTTSVASLGAALAEMGERVLLVDLDPQGSLTFSLGVDPEDLTHSIAEVLLGDIPLTEVMVVTQEGLPLVPSTVELARTEDALVNRTGREQRLRVSLAKIVNEYDWILIDCPPTLGVLTINALSAADEVIIPLQAETLSHRGVGQLLDTIYDVRRHINEDLAIRGVLATMFDPRTAHARAVVAAIEETYDLTVLDPPIPKTIRFAEAPAIGRSILATASRHKGAEAYRSLARTLVEG